MRERALRGVLGFLGVTTAAVGLWAAFAPRSFYEDFPFGRGWVRADGLYNEHLVRDFGAMNLALAVLLLAAAVVLSLSLVRVAAVATLVFSVPHLVYHLRHTGALPDEAINIVTLVSEPVLAVVVLALARSSRRPATMQASTSPSSASSTSSSPVRTGS